MTHIMRPNSVDHIALGWNKMTNANIKNAILVDWFGKISENHIRK